MNSKYLWTGGGMIALEFLGFLALYILFAVSWTTDLLLTIFAVGLFAVFNLTALIFILVGLFKKEDKEK